MHTFTAERPFLNPRLFDDRNFAAGLVFIFVVGIILLATLALLPPFLQNLMGYPVLTAGMVLAPRGIGTMLAMFLVGRLVGRVDARLIVGAGLLVTALSLWEMACSPPTSTPGRSCAPASSRGSASASSSCRLSTLTFATLPRDFRTEATGMFSLMRNVGSSIGISIVVSRLISGTQANHADIAAYVSPFNAALYEPAISQHWNAWSAAGQAALNGVITEQAEVIAYAADYRMMMFLTLATLPALLLMRGPRRSVGSDPAHAVVAD